MKVLCVHPSGLMYTEIFLRLEPLGVELVAASVRRAGHDTRLLDLQAATHRDFFRILDDFRPDAVLFGMNYLANIPEVIDLCKATKARLPRTLTCVGGHSASFTARELLEHAAGGIDCVVRGEGEEAAPRVLDAWRDDPKSLHRLDGVMTLDGEGPPPKQIHSLDDLRPARDLLPHRKKYFIGVLDPAASIEFSRGCPWDCSFCSAWTFYGRSYRKVAPELCAEDLASIREEGVFIVDDVAFIQAEHGNAIADAIERRGLKKRYYLETRGDVLLRNKELFVRWKKLGLEYMFLGLEAIDAEGLKAFRKRVPLGKNFEALEYARSLGIMVAVNIIADPDWDEARFRVIREWALSVPEIVNISVNTPYPGTETFLTDAREFTTRDYRLFDIQHAVLPTKLPLARFYEELVKTQQVLNKKHLGVAALKATAAISARLLLQGQTNFVKMLWKFNSVYDPRRQLADHAQPVKYEMKLPVVSPTKKVDPRKLYVLPPNSKAAQANALITRET
ncbi:hopanoid C-3 methylase HpnR [Pendulispora rubella]|uniref:Hopanoid C-3 methylase HpnR n=1 Tax=Pendulispora rubella TaxID=2741070 RepID=A0ABZ2LDQ9_9BACT